MEFCTWAHDRGKRALSREPSFKALARIVTVAFTVTQRIGIIVHHGLGDLISALPAIHDADRLIGSSGRLEIVVKSALEAGVFDTVVCRATVRTHCVSGRSKYQRLLRMFAIACRLRLARLDILVMPHITSVRFARLLRFLVGAARTIMPGTPGALQINSIYPVPGEHKAEFFARFFAAAGLAVDQTNLCFPPLNESPCRCDGKIRIVLAPAVGTRIEQHKAWPEASFARLAEQIAVRWPDAVIELFAAPPERAVLDHVLAEISPEHRRRVGLSTPPSPMQAAQSLVGAACVVTACSGASHLAALADVPIVGIYGPTNPGFTGPYSRRLYPVRLGWACSPCYRPDFVSGCVSPGCMSGITAEMVCHTVAEALAGFEPPSYRTLLTTEAFAPDQRMS